MKIKLFAQTLIRWLLTKKNSILEVPKFESDKHLIARRDSSGGPE